MPSSQKKSYGSIVQTRACRVLKGILEATKAGESSDPKKLQFRWQEEAGGQKVTIKTTLQTLMHVTNQDGQTKVTTPHVREALEAMRDFLKIMQDHRVKTKGQAQWNFTLTLWSQDIQRNLNEFDKLWESKRSPKAKLQAVPEQPLRLGLKMGAPYPKVRLPDNFVPRVEAFDAVKRKLLTETDRPLVVSAIAGLGGLGKSVLATALVLDAEVQTRFDDGILWITLGQNPDLQNLLGDWIRTLDKSRESYSATTLEAASNYLHTLLLDKRMLLVVDDVWNGAHVELFRVGGAQCRVLMTTREAQIEGADYHALSLTTEEEAIALVRQKLDRQWQPEQEPEVKAFAKSLGYLPLALDLATNQVRDGLSWADLRSEFETERRAVALEVLDSSEAWDCLDENQQRKYSLRACFNLSLRRLSAEQLRQFAWLGVLPEDVSLDARMAVTLWELSPLKAKKALIDLRNRSFLTSGTETLEGELTYRVHDLMHDTARGLIEQATLSAPIQTLADAHAQLLDRYHQKCDRWDRLPNDGYIHRHLTWHLQQAEREDEIHALMAMSDEQGRNAWFEACDQLGQPAIFVQDVRRGWAIAEQSYEEDNTRSIVLQCRYALITATLNSLVENLPSELLAVAVKHEHWTPEHAWAYTEQIQEEYRQAQAIQELVSYLPAEFLEKASSCASSMTNSYHRALSLSCLARANSNFCSDAISAVQELEDENSKAEVLCHLCTHLPSAVLFQIESIIKTLKFLDNRLIVLAELIKRKPTQIQAVLTDLERVEDQARKAEILIKLVPHQPNLFLDALEVVKKVPEKYKHPALLIQLFQYCSLENLNIARKSVGGVSLRYEQEKIMLGAAHLLSDQEAIKLTLTVLGSSGTIDASRSELIQRLVRQKPATFELCFSLALKIEDKHEKLRILTVLSDYRPDRIAQTVSFARQIQDTSSKLKSLGRIGCLDSKTYVSTLKELAKTKDIKACCETLEILTETHPNLVHRLLKEVLGLQEGYKQADILVRIGQGKPENRLNVLQVAHKIHDITTRTKVLVNLVEHDEEIYFQAIENLDDIQIAHSRTEILEELGKINPKHWIEALDILDKMHERQEYNLKLPRMRTIAEKIPKTLFPRLLQSVERLSEPYNKAQVLCSAMKQDKELLSQVLELTGKIEEESSYASIFIQVADQFPDFFQTALDATRKVSFEHNRAVNFTQLAIVTPIGQFSDLLAAVSEMTEGDSMATFFHYAENYIPSRHLEEVLNIIEQIPVNQLKAYALSAYLPRLLLSTYFDWNIHLRLLAHRDRANLMQDLATLYPAIVHLGGTAAVRGMVDAMREVCDQWK